VYGVGQAGREFASRNFAAHAHGELRLEKCKRRLKARPDQRVPPFRLFVPASSVCLASRQGCRLHRREA